MTTHVVACGGHFWCSGGHANGWAILLTLATFAGIVIVVLLFAIFAGKAGYEPKPSPGPSQFTRGLLTGSAKAGYKPSGFRAVTPSGVTVRIRCPHLGGHNTPDQAVACGEREAERIRRTGR